MPLTVATERRLLATHLAWIVAQDRAGEFCDEIRARWGLLRSADGHAAPGRRLRRMPDPGTSCQVRAVTPSPGTDQAVCENCGVTTPVNREMISA